MKKDLLERILAQCIEDGDCLVWQGASPRGRYPQIRLDGKTVSVRKLMHERKHGPLPPGKVAAHSCETRNCICHTEAMTTSEVAKRVAQTGVFSTPHRKAKIAATKRKASWLTPELVEVIKSAPSAKEAARLTGAKERHVHYIRSGGRWGEYASPFAGLGAR